MPRTVVRAQQVADRDNQLDNSHRSGTAAVEDPPAQLVAQEGQTRVGLGSLKEMTQPL